MPRKTTVKIKPARKRNYFLLALFVLLFALVSSYLLIRSYAAIPDNDFRGSGGVVADYSIYADTQNPNERHAVGSTFKRNYYLYFSPGGTYPSGSHHLQFYVRWYTKEVKHLPSKFNCGDATPCVKVATPGYSEGKGLTNLIYCFEITPAMRSQGNVRLFSTRFQQISATNQNWFDDLLYLFSGECSGYYENGPPAHDANYLAFSTLGNGSLGGGVARRSTGDQNDGNDKSGDGNQGQGTGSGGGGGGSSTNQQGDKPNTVPSTSNQGAGKQPDLSPSPFYDGKEYKPGSAADSGIFGGVTVAGKPVTKVWPFITGAAVLAAAGVVIYWRKYRNKSKK